MWKAEARRIDICSVGPVLEVNHDSEDDSRIGATDLENEPISIEEGDQILATGLLPPPSMDICTSSTISQGLLTEPRVSLSTKWTELGELSTKQC